MAELILKKIEINRWTYYVKKYLKRLNKTKLQIWQMSQQTLFSLFKTQHNTTIKIMSLDQKLHKLRVKQQVKQRFKKRWSHFNWNFITVERNNPNIRANCHIQGNKKFTFHSFSACIKD